MNAVEALVGKLACDYARLPDGETAERLLAGLAEANDVRIASESEDLRSWNPVRRWRAKVRVAMLEAVGVWINLAIGVWLARAEMRERLN